MSQGVNETSRNFTLLGGLLVIESAYKTSSFTVQNLLRHDAKQVFKHGAVVRFEIDACPQRS